jgi:hypothetical protein
MPETFGSMIYKDGESGISPNSVVNSPNKVVYAGAFPASTGRKYISRTTHFYSTDKVL